jgi:RNA polymerase sigma factor (sigma-70 family)
MESAHPKDDWQTCFTQLGPALLLFARRWTNCRAEAEDIVQEAFVRFWRRQHSIANRALLYATVRSTALDRLRSDQRRARREAAAIEPSLQWSDTAANVGSVRISDAQGNSVVLVTKTPYLGYLCIADSAGVTSYGQVDANSPAACTGGWMGTNPITGP